jgi:type IV pilus assembly protein PilY1
MFPRRLARSLIATSAGLALVAGPSVARAQQVDTNPPLPNVLLLVDNSGSMERMIDAGTQEAESACNCTDTGGTITCNWTPAGGGVAANRWNTLLQALTGPLPTSSSNSTFNCVAMSRNAGTTFASEYQIGGQAPYDINYYLPFHRMVAYDSGTACVYAPGYLPGGSASEGVGPNNLFASGTLSTAFPTTTQPALVTRAYGSQITYGSANTNTCNFNQLPTGAIATMSSFMRFGLMTFDSDPAAGIGVTLGSSPSVLPIASGGPFAGMWSYYQNWSTSPALAPFGNPGGCGTSSIMAVGARNPAAPPWEGRLMYFPTTNDSATQASNNSLVQQVLLASRPYGATPLAGMFRGAQYFFGQQASFRDSSAGAPAQDPLVTGGCRKQYIILMTDGGPNLDLQAACGAAGMPAGVCPFPLPYGTAGAAPPNTPPGGTAATLYNNGNTPSVQTFVIGFAVSQDSGSGNSTVLGCQDFAAGHSLSAVCDCTNPNLPATTYSNVSNSTNCALGTTGCQSIGPCCVLQCIAQNGGPAGSTAYFADNAGSLNTALGQILGQIAQNSTTRTTPAYSPVVNSASTTNATSTFLASFNPGPGTAWSGDIQRQRYACTGSGLSMQAQTITPTSGDDFAADLLLGGSGRTFIAFEPALTQPNGSGRDATAIIRPYVSTSVGDGLGQYTAATYSGSAASVIGSGSNSITPDALGVTANSSYCQYRSTSNGALKSLAQSPNTPSTCMQMLLDFTFAQTFGGAPADFTFASRVNTPMGDVLDAEPAVVGAPGSLVQDPSYEAFQANWANVPSPNNDTATSTGPRKQIVYTATNDGLLHAFWAGVGLTSKQNNELWAMLLPAVMPNIGSTYPSNHASLLDGSPVVKDVVWDRAAGANDGGVWRTTLVAGFGPAFPGYYGIDVTNPVPAATTNGTAITDDPPTATTSGDDLTVGAAIPKEGPVFRWQLTKMPSTNFQIFETGATPAITTLFMDPGDGNGKREIGVAILPGGIASNNGIPITPTAPKNGAAGCARSQTSDPSPSSYPARTSVNCWGATGQASDAVPGRAVTIVRLDTGEILRVFGRNNTGGYNDFPATDTLAKAPSRVINVPLDSPMTGKPIVYPNQVGADATKFFISDADGTIWRFDVSDPSPANWSGQLFLDLYNTNSNVDPLPGFTAAKGGNPASCLGASSPCAWADGQPVVVSPVLSLDTSAQLVLNVATGSQASFTNTGTNFVYSITEKAGSSSFQANVNWFLDMSTFPGIMTGDTPGAIGARVSGPMTVFNGNLYFASFTAPASTTTCIIGTALLWGMDYTTAAATPGQGGKPTFVPPSSTNVQDNYNPFALAASATGVIPGVSIFATPSCVSYPSNPTTDNYVAGASHYTPSQYTAPATPFALNVQIGGNTKGGVQSLQIGLPTPTSPTMIDSWAAILE